MNKYFICLACLVLLSAGCGNRIDEKAIERVVEKETGADADVDISEEGMNIRGRTEDGEFSISSGENAEVSENFPSDVLVYKPSEVSTSMDMPQGQSLTLTTTDDAQKVLEKYKQEMTANGWSEKTSMLSGDQSMLIYGKEERAVQIHIMTSDDKTEIVLIASEN